MTENASPSPSADPPSSPEAASPLLAWWERLPLGVQVGVVLPVMVVALAVVHITLLGQPVGRGTGYGIFWGVLATFVIVGSSRMERAKREARWRARHPDGDPRRRAL